MAYSRVSTFSGDYLRVTDNKGKTHDVLTGSDDGRHSNTSLAWGAGVQFNPTESVAIDIAYEGSGSGDWRTDGFIVGVGYRVLLQAQVHTHILSVLVLIRTPLRLVHMDIPSPLTLLVTRKTPSKTSHLTIL